MRDGHCYIVDWKNERQMATLLLLQALQALLRHCKHHCGTASTTAGSASTNAVAAASTAS